MDEFNNKDDSLITCVLINDELKLSYLMYAIAVIFGRALPDLRDGLKPVHRRILYAMYNSSCYHTKPYRKSARIVGDVMGNFHPHGDAAIYDSLVRMAQPFSLSVPLIDGQGNFGSIDGDPAAAMRYTEARMSRIAHELLTDIRSDTVDFQDNYDGSSVEPVVLPAQFPNILLNGASGVAIGMATNIPPHNFTEIIDASLKYIENPQVELDELMSVMYGPDFPTGGILIGKSGIHSAFLTGRGSIILRSKVEFENISDSRVRIVVKEIPYQVTKTRIMEDILKLIKSGKISTISEMRDESDRDGIRLVIELKRGVIADVVLNQLYRFTSLQVSFGIQMLVLDDRVPKIMPLIDIIKGFVKFRKRVLTRRTKFLLKKARDRANVLLAFCITIDNIDEVIKMIRSSKNAEEATNVLKEKLWFAKEFEELICLISENPVLDENKMYSFTDSQVKAILDMKLHQLTSLEKNKVSNELDEKVKEIRKCVYLLSSDSALMDLMSSEMQQLKEHYNVPRRTEISDEEDALCDVESLIPKEDIVVTVTLTGYIKRSSLSSYTSQRRGGKGKTGHKLKETDVVTTVLKMNTHTDILFFSNIGQVYKMRGYAIPIGDANTRGRALVNLLPLSDNEYITSFRDIPETDVSSTYIIFATKFGNIRRNALSDFMYIPKNGKRAISFEDDDQLIGVDLCNENNHILLSTTFGKIIRFPVTAVRTVKSRTSDGVRGISCVTDDTVISLSVLSSAEVEDNVRIECNTISSSLMKNLRLAFVEYEKLDDNLLKKVNNLGLNILESDVIKYINNEELLLSVTENGYGKLSSAYEYRITNRGGKGVSAMSMSKKSGKVVSTFPVTCNDDVMIMTDGGVLIRVPLLKVSVTGRNTQGVRLIKLKSSDRVVSIAKVAEKQYKEECEKEDSEEDSEVTSSEE